MHASVSSVYHVAIWLIFFHDGWAYKGEDNQLEFVLTVAALWWRNKFKGKCRECAISLLEGGIVNIFDKHL